MMRLVRQTSLLFVALFAYTVFFWVGAKADDPNMCILNCWDAYRMCTGFSQPGAACGIQYDICLSGCSRYDWPTSPSPTELSKYDYGNVQVGTSKLVDPRYRWKNPYCELFGRGYTDFYATWEPINKDAPAAISPPVTGPFELIYGNHWVLSNCEHQNVQIEFKPQKPGLYHAHLTLYFVRGGKLLSDPIIAIDFTGVGVDNSFGAPGVSPSVTSAELTPTPTVFGWNRADVTVGLTAQDPAGLGVKKLVHMVTGAQLSAEVTQGVTATVPITAAGTVTVTYFAIDNYGNIEPPHYLNVNLDKTLPTLTLSTPWPPPNKAGWNNSDVHIPFSAADTLSGIASTTPEGDEMVLSNEGDNVYGEISATDLAGNQVTLASVPVRLDKTPPVIGLLVPTATDYPHTSVLTTAWQASDSMSGVAVQTGAVDGAPVLIGDTLDMLNYSLGTHVFAVTTSDLADNSIESEAVFTVVATIESVGALVDRLCGMGSISSAETCTQLHKTLDAAACAAQWGARAKALEHLAAFQTQLASENGITLDARGYNLLDTDIRYVKDNLTVVPQPVTAAKSDEVCAKPFLFPLFLPAVAK